MAMMRVPEKRSGGIPQYRQQPAYDTTPGATLGARLSDSAGGIAAQGAQSGWQAVINTGKAVQGAAKVGFDLYTEYSRTKAQEAYNKFQESMQSDLYGENGIFNRKGENALTSVADAEKIMRDRAGEFEKNLGDMGKEFFQKQIGTYGRQLLPQVQRHATSEFNTWQINTQKTRAELARNAALENYNDPEVFAQKLQESGVAIMEIARISGWSREQTELATRENASGIYLEVGNAALSRDNVKQAQSVLASGMLTGEDKIRLEAAIRNKQEQLEAKARAEEERRTREFRAEQSLNIVSMFKDDPLSGVNELLTPEGRKKYGLDAVTAKSTIDMLRAQDSQNKQQQKEFNSRYADQTINTAYMYLVGDPQKGISPDPAMAFSIIDNSDLDAVTKIEAKQKLEAGTFGKTRNPAKVNAMASAIISGQDITDGTITSMMARGEANASDVSNLKQLKKDMDGPLNGYFKRGKDLADTAFARPQFAAGTPEAAIKEDRARAQINNLIREAYKKGGDEGVEKLFNGDTLFNVLQGNMPNLQDQLNNINGIINVSPDTNQQLKRKAGESPESWWNRVGK